MTNPDDMPSTNEADTYLTGVFDQIGAAVRDNNLHAVADVLDRVDDDGYPRTAQTIQDGLIRATILGKVE
jgi:hypothetical protein